MFGEKALIGQSEGIIDNKGRIFIPAWTDREPNEYLGVLKDESLGIYRIYNLKSIVSAFNYFENQISQSKNSVDKRNYQKQELEFAKSIIEYSKVDKQGRILIANIAKDNLSAKFIGLNDHLVLELKK